MEDGISQFANRVAKTHNAETHAEYTRVRNDELAKMVAELKELREENMQLRKRLQQAIPPTNKNESENPNLSPNYDDHLLTDWSRDSRGEPSDKGQRNR